MIKARLLSFLEGMDGPPSFGEYRALLSADILQFPDEARLPSDPGAVYGRGWDTWNTPPRRQVLTPESPKRENGSSANLSQSFPVPLNSPTPCEMRVDDRPWTNNVL
jgi:hypothetical protein